mgnify:CR=1 FL=1
MLKTKHILSVKILRIFLVFFVLGCANKTSDKLWVYSSSNDSKVTFALQDLFLAVNNDYQQVDISKKDKASIILKVESTADLKKEGFSIKNENNKIIVSGFDEAGLMYGTLELAEQK